MDSEEHRGFQDTTILLLMAFTIIGIRANAMSACGSTNPLACYILFSETTTICFGISMLVLLIIVSGVPLNKYVFRVFRFVMLVTETRYRLPCFPTETRY
jgi:hypothetical protein